MRTLNQILLAALVLTGTSVVFASQTENIRIINQSDAPVYVNIDIEGGGCVSDHQVPSHSTYIYVPPAGMCSDYSSLNKYWYVGLSMDNEAPITTDGSGSLCSTTFNWYGPWALNKTINNIITVVGSKSKGYSCY